jgi:hypothetical protein
MEDWEDISEEEDWAFKTRFILVFLMNWEAPMLDVM